jgi:hypothetical protein
MRLQTVRIKSPLEELGQVVLGLEHHAVGRSAPELVRAR